MIRWKQKFIRYETAWHGALAIQAEIAHDTHMIAQNAARQMLFFVTPSSEIVCVEVEFVLADQKLESTAPHAEKLWPRSG